MIESMVSDLASMALENGIDGSFRERAATEAQKLQISDLPYLKSIFHSPPKESPIFDTGKHGLGGWLSSCQFAVFELIFNMGEAVIPFLREIAFGEYDWTQANAIELLCRFAAKGIQREETITDLNREMPRMRWEALLYVAEPLLHQAREDKAIEGILRDLNNKRFQSAIREVPGDW
jgi:hypothetical protein